MNAIESFITNKSTNNRTLKVKQFELTGRQSTNKDGYHINNYFDHIYLINLKKRPDRLVKVLQKLRKLGISVEVINAVNGRVEPHFTNYMEYVDRPISSDSHFLEIKKNRKVITSPGAWGYLLTWINILEDAIQKRYKNFLCFDDDIIFIKNFHQRFAKWIRDIRPDWKVLQIGATQIPKFRNKIIGKHRNYFHPDITDGSYATAIDQEVYSYLLEETMKMNCPFDSGPLREMYKKYPKRCYAAWPHLIIADVSDSNIRGHRDMIKFAENLEWNLDLYDWEFKLDLISIILLVRNLEENIISILLSFLAQKYSQIEIIVIDDASTDKTGILLDKFHNQQKQKHTDQTKIMVIHNKKPLGPRVSQELGFSKAKGKYKIFEIATAGEAAECFNNQIEQRIIQILRG